MAHNTNRQGAGFELQIMHYLAGCDCETTYSRPRHVGWRGFGYDVLRSSGSRGKVDVVAIGPNPIDEPGGFLLFIQGKLKAPKYRTPLSPEERQILMDLALRAGALPLTASLSKDEKTKRLRPHFRLLTGPGPREWTAWEPGEEN